MTPPRGLGGLSGFDPMSLIQKMQKEMQAMQDELEQMEVEGTAGGGAVKVIMNGHYKVKSITIDPELLEENDVDMLQDLILSALNNAWDKAHKASEEKMAAIQQMLGPLSGLLGM